MECRGAKLQLWRQYGSRDLQQGLGLEYLVVTENGIEMVGPMRIVSYATYADFMSTAYQLR